jgi:hypothetical protein
MRSVGAVTLGGVTWNKPRRFDVTPSTPVTFSLPTGGAAPIWRGETDRVR